MAVQPDRGETLGLDHGADLVKADERVLVDVLNSSINEGKYYITNITFQLHRQLPRKEDQDLREISRLEAAILICKREENDIGADLTFIIFDTTSQRNIHC